MEKGPGDLVTEADLESQRTIREILMSAFPEHGFRGEEDIGDPRDPASEGHAKRVYEWIVDPLDGTTNYVHGVPTFAVSIALVKDGDPLVGVVYEPVADRCFRAIRDRGAFLNDSPIRVSSCDSLRSGLIGASLPAFVTPESLDLRRFNEIVGACQAIRRMGSAAMNLCYVAAGWLDGYWGETAKAWDVAAGILLVQEAGGYVTGLDGSPFRLMDPHFVCAGTRELHAELSERLARVE
jgi:myo-inositol-1(or 4)-monophosphatase